MKVALISLYAFLSPLFAYAISIPPSAVATPKSSFNALFTEKLIESENWKALSSYLHLAGFSHYDLPPRPALVAATDEFGATWIDTTKLPFESDVLDSGIRPWSGWWFPKKEAEFTKGADGLSILEKFDWITGANGKPHSAWQAELELDRFSSRRENWEGLCDAWALASILEPEPKRAINWLPPLNDKEAQSVSLSVGEQKGLLMKSYEAVDASELKIYGEKFLGNKDSWIQPDLFPDQFHRLVEVYLGQKKQAFVMDRDPGVEVWNVPVYKANFRMEEDPNDPGTVIVRLWLYTAAPLDIEEKDQLGTKTVILEYNYTLSGELRRDGHLVVKSGRWLNRWKDSEGNHPDYVVVPKAKTIEKRSYNPFVNYEKVRSLLGSQKR